MDGAHDISRWVESTVLSVWNSTKALPFTAAVWLCKIFHLLFGKVSPKKSTWTFSTGVSFWGRAHPGAISTVLSLFRSALLGSHTQGKTIRSSSQGSCAASAILLSLLFLFLFFCCVSVVLCPCFCLSPFLCDAFALVLCLCPRLCPSSFLESGRERASVNRFP